MVPPPVRNSVWKPFSREVIPSYRDVPAAILGAGEIVLGLVILMDGCAALVLQAYSSVGGCALLAGLGSIAAGGFSVMSSRHKEHMVVTATAIMSGVSSVFAFSLLIAAGIGMGKEKDRWSAYSLASRETVDVIAMLLSVACIAACTGTLINCCVSLFNGCFNLNSSAKYVRDNSSYPIEETHSNGYDQPVISTQNFEPSKSKPSKPSLSNATKDPPSQNEVNTTSASGHIAVLQVV